MLCLYKFVQVSMRNILFLFLAIVNLGTYAQFEESMLKSERDAYLSKLEFKAKRSGQQYDLLYHHLNIEIDPIVRYIHGNVYTLIKAEEDNFSLFSMDLHSSMSIDSVVSDDVDISFTRLNDEIQLSIPPLSKGGQIGFTIFYQGDPTKHDQRAFSYGFQKDGPVAWTLSQPYGALGWWPCKQQLTDKIDSIDISLTVPFDNIAASLGVLQPIDTLNDSTQVYHWVHRYPVATYLVAVAVSNYYEESHFIHLSDGDSVFHVDYMYPAYKPAADTLRWNIDGMMRAFDSLFGEYPYIKEKHGHVMFGRGGGMEHQTMSFMGTLNYDLMAHELGHQWFGDKITCATWQDLWLNEGWATYTAAIAREFADTRANHLNYLLETRTTATIDEEGSVYAYDTSSVRDLFSAGLRYAKGAMVLHQLRWEVGDEAFFEGVRNYTSDAYLCYGFAHTIDFQEAIEKTSGEDLTDYFKRYIYQEGYPVITSEWHRINNETIRINLIQRTTHNSVDFFPLKIEFAATGEGKDSTFSIQHSSSEEFIDVNLGFKVDELQIDPNIWLLAKSILVEGKHTNLGSVTTYPNPGSGIVKTYLQERKVDSYEVIDVQGRVQLSGSTPELKNGPVLIDVNTLLSGLYFIKLYSGGDSVVDRFIKK